MVKLVGFFLLVALVPTATVAWLSFRSQRASLEQAEYNRLTEARQLCKTEILNYLLQTRTNLTFLSTTPAALEAFRMLTGSGSSAAVMPSDLRAKVMADMERLISRWKSAFGKNNGYEDMVLVNSNGDVVYTHRGGEEQDENLKDAEALKDSSLGRLWATIMKTQEPRMADFSQYGSDKSVVAFMGVPVFDQVGVPCGGLFLRLGTERVRAVFRRDEDAGKGLKVHLVGSDYLLRSQHSSPEEETGIPGEKVETEATREAFQGRSGTMIVSRYDGRNMLTSYSLVGLKEYKELGAGFDWAVISEMDQSRAIKPVTDLLLRVLLIILVSALGVGAVAYCLAGSIARPVRFVSQHAARVSEGDLTADLPELGRSDEIGALGESFRIMVNNLRDQARQVRQGVGVLSLSVNEISSTISQISVGTSKTASAITETTTTVSQVKEAARVSSSKAKNVSESSRQATDQVRNILQATRQWISAVVMATEQGIKAVDAGMEQSALAGESIEALVTSVVQSSQAASIIETSSDQQTIGVEQVSSAMARIEQTMGENLQSTA